MNDKLAELKFKKVVSDYYNDRSFQLISEYVNQLDILQREKAVLREQYEFVSVVSRQLKAPIGSMKMSLGALRDSISNKNLLTDLYEKFENLSSLINDFLFFVENRGGYELTTVEEFSIAEIIQMSRGAIGYKAKRKKIKVNFHRPQFDDTVTGDRDAVSNVIYYLLDNAIAYNRLNGTIKISIEKKGKNIITSVKDTGIGIPKKDQKKIFEKFHRGSNAPLGRSEGSGVRLYIAKLIVEAHGGRIWFESEEGKGTTFYFSMPLKAVSG